MDQYQNSEILQTGNNRYRTTVWLIKDDRNEHIFFCHHCKAPVFKYEGSVITIIPGDANANGERVVKFPIIIKCRGRSAKWGDCPVDYLIEGQVE